MYQKTTIDGFGNLDVELSIADTYRKHQHDPVALREAACLAAMFPASMLPIQESDLLAGRFAWPLAGYSLEIGTYYCLEPELRQEAAKAGFDPSYMARVEDMLAFWKTESTHARHDATLSPEVLAAVRNQIANGHPRLAGTLPDYDKLMRLGIGGLLAQVRAAAQKVSAPDFYRGIELSLGVLANVCRHYARQARDQAASAGPARAAQLQEMADSLERVAVDAPVTLRDAIQLHWLYSLVATVVNYGRMDIAMGDFYVRDLESGRLTQAEALTLLQSFWRLIAARRNQYNSRVIVGGRGRRNEANADRFALLAMEATRTVIETEPQLTLRFYAGQNPALMAKALDVIGEGRTFPMLYNDDVNVPAVAHCFGVPEADAERYSPYGCGEYALEGLSFGSPNCGFNLLKALEVALHGGVDAVTGQPLGLPCGGLESYATFEDLLAVYKKQVEHYALQLGLRHAHEYEVERNTAGYGLVSALYEHCLERGKSIVQHGCRYNGAILETFGMVNTADSLAAIKTLVYEKRLLTPGQLLAVLKADFAGYPRERELFLSAPKYGNDDEVVDSVMRLVSDHAGRCVRSLAGQLGLDYCAIVNINNFMNVDMGRVSAASADGRRLGDPLANGSTPTAGRDKKGATALVKSLAKPDPSVHAGYVHNIKFSPSMFGSDRPKLEALLQTYFRSGGTQAMITVVRRGDMENAMREPEEYGDLIVRVGGFSARFTTLPRDLQQDLLNRTLY